jgi:hypothetical protein
VLSRVVSRLIRISVFPWFWGVLTPSLNNKSASERERKKNILKIGKKDWENDWQKIGCFFFRIFLSRSPSLVCNQHTRMEEQEQVEQDHRVEKKKPSGHLRGITEEMVA